jgi:membrane-associated protein
LPHFDLTEIIKAGGLLLVWGIVFTESGLFIGFFLPGDSLLFTAGFLASQNWPGTNQPILNIWLLSIGSGIAAIVGDSVGYSFGRRVGPRIFSREDSIWFHRKHLERAHAFYEKHGGKTIILARFMPVVRTFAPIVAGAAQMHYRHFLAYNVIGGILWGVGVTWAGYFLGTLIPDVDRYLLPIIALIIVVSVAPSVWHVWRESGDDIVAYVRTWLRRRSGKDEAVAPRSVASVRLTDVE